MPSDSTRKRPRRKPAQRPDKPYPEYPLYSHPLGYWSKKIDGRILHFGRWARVRKGKLEHLPYEPAWKDAYATFKARVDDLHDGRVLECVVRPEPIKSDDVGQLKLAVLANRFLTAKQRKVEAGELSPRSFAEYRQATDLLVDKFGGAMRVCKLLPCDFESLRADMAKRWGAARLGKFVVLIRAVFGYAYENGLIEHAVRFGSEFKRPEKPVLRKLKAGADKRLFTPAEIRLILAYLAGEEVTIQTSKGTKKVQRAASSMLRSATLLGINNAIGNTDVAGLQFKHLEARGGWLVFSRSKTGLDRRSPLWPQTREAIEQAIQDRPDPKSAEDADCVFLNRFGGRMVQSTTESHSDYVSKQFRKVLKDLHVSGRRGFYALRHTAATIGLQTGDRDGVKLLMGHAQHDILDGYDELGPSDERLQRIVDHIHNWLFGTEAKGGAN